MGGSGRSNTLRQLNAMQPLNTLSQCIPCSLHLAPSTSLTSLTKYNAGIQYPISICTLHSVAALLKCCNNFSLLLDCTMCNVYVCIARSALSPMTEKGPQSRPCFCATSNPESHSESHSYCQYTGMVVHLIFCAVHRVGHVFG